MNVAGKGKGEKKNVLQEPIIVDVLPPALQTLKLDAPLSKFLQKRSPSYCRAETKASKTLGAHTFNDPTSLLATQSKCRALGNIT